MVLSSKTIPFILARQLVLMESDNELRIVQAKWLEGEGFYGERGKGTGNEVGEVI